jgi:steroid delta-isomerase-like uncharacterized protein
MPKAESHYPPNVRHPATVVKKFVEGLHTHNVDLLMSLYAADATNYQVADQPVKGRDEIRKGFEAFFRACPDSTTIANNIIEDGEWAALEWRGTGTHLGEFAGNPASGKKFELKGCGFFHVKNGLIVYQRGYWDKATWFSQLGIKIS